MARRNRADAFLRVDRGTLDRYRLTRVHLDTTVARGRQRYSVWTPPPVEATEFDERHTVTGADLGHLDLIAYQYYGIEEYWFAIAYVNKIRNPITDMFIGQQLIIPALQAVTDALGLAEV
jgi:nucleoid-associated protein YgaU